MVPNNPLTGWQWFPWPTSGDGSYITGQQQQDVRTVGKVMTVFLLYSTYNAIAKLYVT